MAARKPPCKYGKKCYRKNADHLRDFSHPNPKKSDDEEENDDSLTTKVVALTEKKNKKQDEGDMRGRKNKSPSPDSDAERIAKKRKVEDDEPQSAEENVKDDDEKADNEMKNEDDEVEDPPSSPEDVKESIKMKYLVEMPDDFYQFWDLCVSLNPSDPLGALKCLKLKLVGPFDIMSGRHKKVRKNKFGRRPNFLLHYRFYYDPPEFQTVLLSQENDSLHFGYFRDDPKEKPVFVASNSPGSSTSKEKISACGDNLFAAVHNYASKVIKTSTPFQKTPIQKLIKSLEGAVSKHKLDLSASTKGMKERQKKVVCPSFHGAGIVVPVDDNEIGYRPVPETPGDLKAIFKRISEAKTDKEKDRHLEQLEELITLVQFANDECDYGEGLELGIDLFSFGGKVFHPQISILVPLAYKLLNRHEFASIISAHLDRRRRVDECVDELSM